MRLSDGADPEGAIGRIYRGLELGDTSHFALALRARVAESSEYRVSRYRVSREEVAVLAARGTDYIGRYDYGDAIAAALAAENRNSVPPLPSAARGNNFARGTAVDANWAWTRSC